MQQILFVVRFKSALHVSGNKFAHPQEHFLTAYTAFAGESNDKLPPRTCPGCSVPEPYRSHDWALVPAKPGLQG